MNYLKYSILTLFMAVLFVGVGSTAMAQTEREAIQVYNQAIEAEESGDFQKAITMYTQAMSIAEQLGAEGQNIVENVQNTLPRLYYQIALNTYKSFQSSPSVSGLETAISDFETAAEMAQKYGSSDIASQANSAITTMMYQKSVLQYRQENFDAALASVNAAIERNPDYANAYYHKSLIINKQGTLEEYLAAVQEAVSIAERVGNTQVAEQAKSSVAQQLTSRGAQMVNDENYSGAIEILNTSLEYNPEYSNTYFRLAQAYNARGDWSTAVENAQQALEYSNGGRADQAKIYYALATAYKGLGQYDQACDAFANAAYGTFRQSAQHEMEFVLKCGQ